MEYLRRLISASSENRAEIHPEEVFTDGAHEDEKALAAIVNQIKYERG